jgi:hypothetical protein
MGRTKEKPVKRASYEDSIDVVGKVVMARVNPLRMAILLPDGRELEADFGPEEEDAVLGALCRHRICKVRVQGRARYSKDGLAQRITKVDRLEGSLDKDRPYDPSRKPIWEVIDELLADVPEEELAKLPRDGATQHDHYIYGLPKRKE